MASEVLARISNLLIARSWNASNTAYSNDHFHKEEEEEEEEGDTVFAFKPSSSESGWFTPENESSFGETNMNREQFPCMRSFSNDVDATVNAAFLNKLQLLRSTLFPHSVQTVIDKKKSKRIVFTGHSSGGATAILATVWYLETYFTKKKSDDIFPEPLCLTFGAPLVGDSVFNHALGRENWSRYFVNFVTRFDVVPRIMLAPKESTKQTLPYALFQLDPRTANQENDPSIAEFYATVMKEVETAARQAGCKLLEDGENPFLDTFSSFLELSPYRPVGTFVFSTETRLVSVSNSDAILQLLFYTSQSSNEHELSQRPYQSIRDHNRYQDMVDSLGMKVVDKLELNHLAALSDLGVSTEAARDCVQVAFEAEKKRDDNQSNIDKKILEKPKDAKKPYTIVEKLDWMDTYQQQCLASGKGYYDSFKESDKPDDFTANVERAKLAGFFDDAFDKLKKGQLPDGFEGRSEWIELVTRYRRLVEPLDISNYYRHLKNRDTGSYMEQGRPKRYKHSQRLNEHKLLKEGMSAEEIKRSGCGSCFWAEVEELRGKEYVEVEEKVKKLQELLQGWIIVAEVDKKHVFMEGSTFRKWWDSLPDHHKLNYPL